MMPDKEGYRNNQQDMKCRGENKGKSRIFCRMQARVHDCVIYLDKERLVSGNFSSIIRGHSLKLNQGYDVKPILPIIESGMTSQKRDLQTPIVMSGLFRLLKKYATEDMDCREMQCSSSLRSLCSLWLSK